MSLIHVGGKQKDGIVIGNKARSFGQGFTQLKGLDYDERFAHVTKLEGFLLFLAYVSFMNLIVYQMDVKVTFQHGELQEEVFLKQLPTFDSNKFPNHVYRPDKVVYRLKQAPRVWYDTFTNYLVHNEYR